MPTDESVCVPDSSPNVEQARAGDELERAVQALTFQVSPSVLESTLRALGDPTTDIVGAPPLRAATAFRDSALKRARAKMITASQLRELVVHLTETLGTERLGMPTPAAPTCRFDRAIFVFGLRRGGNHAITKWLRGHFPDDATAYFNSAEIALLETGDGTLTLDRHTYSMVRLDPCHQVLIVGYENLDPAIFPLAHNAQVAARSDVVVVLRDYPNTVASIAKQARDDPAFAYRYRIRDLLELWGRYAEYYRNKSFGFTYISFNRWFGEVRERRMLSHQLGLQHSDRNLNAVSSVSGGSSFDGVRHHGSAQKMKVLHRWESMLDDGLFLFLLLADEHALEASAELFGGFPFTRSQLLERWRARTNPI